MKKCIVDTSSFENVIKARNISKTKESSVKIDVHDLGYQSDDAAPIPLNMRMERFLSHLKNVESSDIYFKIFQNSINSHKNLSTVLEDFKLIVVVSKAGKSKRIIGVERSDLAIKVDERAFSFYEKDSEGKFQKAVSTKKGMGVFAELYGVHDDYQSKVDNLVSADSKDLSVKDVAEEKKSLDSSDLVELDAVMISGVNRSVDKEVTPVKKDTSVEKTEQDFTKSPIGQLDENQISIQGIGTPDILSEIGTLKDGSGGSIVSGRVSRSQRRKGVTPIFPQRRGESSSNEDVGSLEISGEGQTQFDHQQLDFDDESSILSKLESSGLKTPSKDGDDFNVTKIRGNQSLRRFSQESYEEKIQLSEKESSGSDSDDERPNSPFLDLVQSPVKSPYYETKVTPLAISDSLIHGEVKTPVIESGEKGTGLGRFSANSYEESSDFYEDSDEEVANQSPTPLKEKKYTASSDINPFSSLVQVDMEERSNLGQSSFVEQSDDSVSETVSKTSVKSDELDFSEAKGSNLETPLATRKSLIQDEFQTPIVEAINKSDSGSSEESYEESPESYQNSSEDEKQSLTPLKRRSDVVSSRDVDHSQAINSFSSLVQSSSVDKEEQSNLGQSRRYDSVAETVSKTPVKSDELDFSKVSIRSRTPTPKRDHKEQQQHSPSRDVVRSPFADIVGESNEDKSKSPVSLPKGTNVAGSKVGEKATSPLRTVDTKKDAVKESPVRDDKKSTSLRPSIRNTVNRGETANDDDRADKKAVSPIRGAMNNVSSFRSKFAGKKDDPKDPQKDAAKMTPVRKAMTNVTSFIKKVAKKDNPSEVSNPFAFAKSDSSVDKREDNREGELAFPPSDSSRKLVLRERKDTISQPPQRKVVLETSKNFGVSDNPKEESEITNRSSKSSSSINLEGAVGSDAHEFLMGERNSKVTHRGGKVDGQSENLFSSIFFSPEATEDASSRNLESGKMSTGESDKTPVSIKSQRKTETITPKEKVISRESMSYRGASLLSPSTSISDADAMKPQAGVMPQIIECGPAGVWLDTNFVFLYENRESKTKDEVKELAFNRLVAIIDQVTLDFQKNEKYHNMHLKMKDVIELIDYAREMGGVANKFNEGRTGYEKNEGIEQWKVKFSSSFQKYCRDRGFHTDKDCDISAKLTRLPPEVYDILKGRDPDFEPIKNERSVRLSFSGVELSPKTRSSLSPKGQGAVV